MTLEAWIYPTINSGTRDVVVKEGLNVDIYNLYHRNFRGFPEGNVYVGGTNRTAEGTALPINTWAHLATTYDGSALRLYVNGTEVATTTLSGAISTSAGAVRIGGNSIWGESFQGRIDDVRIYNRALSATEIQTDMSNPVASGTTTPPSPPQDLRIVTVVTVEIPYSRPNNQSQMFRCGVGSD